MRNEKREEKTWKWSDKNGDIKRVTDRRIIDEVCCYLTLPKARERRGAEEKGEQLPTLVFLVKVVSLCVEGLLQKEIGRERNRESNREKERRGKEREKGKQGDKVGEAV